MHHPSGPIKLLYNWNRSPRMSSYSFSNSHKPTKIHTLLEQESCRKGADLDVRRVLKDFFEALVELAASTAVLYTLPHRIFLLDTKAKSRVWREILVLVFVWGLRGWSLPPLPVRGQAHGGNTRQSWSHHYCV